MPNDHTSTIDTSLAAYVRTPSGANKSAATITAYRTGLSQFLTYLRETNRTITAAAHITRADIEEDLTHLAGQGLSGTTRASSPRSGSFSASSSRRTLLLPSPSADESGRRQVAGK
jgi:site-specific recombinase XerD